MSDVATQTEDILINGIPLSEFVKINISDTETTELVWDFLKEGTDDVDSDNSDNSDNSGDNNDSEMCNSISSSDVECISLSEKDTEDLRESVLYCVEQNVINNPLSFSDPAFHIMLENSVYEIVEETFSDNSFIRNDVFKFTEKMENQVEEIITKCLEEYFDTVVPPRSYPTSRILQPPNVAEITKISLLRALHGKYLNRNHASINLSMKNVNHLVFVLLLIQTR